MTIATDRARLLRRALALTVLLGLLAIVAGSWLGGGIVATLLSPSVAAEAKLQSVRAFVLAAGSAAPLVYVAAVIVEVVVAPIPGLMLYAPGGTIFGGFWGGLLSLVGNVLGAAVAFGIVRVLGREAVARRIGDGALHALEERLAAHGVAVVFVMRVNPLTSSDLVSYAAGLTTMPAWKLVTGTALGMAPLCFAQSYAAAGLVDRYPWLVYGVAILGAGYVAAIGWLVWRVLSSGHLERS